MTDKFLVNLTENSLMEQVDSNNNVMMADTVSEEMRCQYSSKRCENERTHKKSGGLHKFCAMHREKANRNQMRLDHRRRVLKQQQKEQQRKQQAQQMQPIQAQQQMLRSRCHSPAAMAAGQNFYFGSRMQHSLAGAMCSPVSTKFMSPPNMTISMRTPMQVYPTMEMQSQQQPISNLPLFDQHDLDILEAMLFSSDEEQNDVTPTSHCSTAQFFHTLSIVNV
ncbi:unnamed protein product [Peronospora belbahrii]|uniref:SBP-type domain-containing protein n=1 Tax=Peronospora belbahrii TaxID=622444 RepID=A0AAU9L955_9STRA|nr:unnamed protein product [Peronospora belbahrii]CAH0513574.1 unnamed protein product [Peronospora belbahrii]